MSHPTPSDACPPSLVDGRYRLDGLIGQGGMATVHRVTDMATGEEKALKQLTPARNASHAQRAAELFELEYHTLVQLAHPSIVTAHDYGVADGTPYYTMELLDGGDLHDRAPLPWQEVCRVGRDACSALSLIHSRRLVYRDLSPRNLRCTPDGGAKLIDFGAIAEMGTAQHAVCTPVVAAPEVVRLQPLDGRADLFALGATLYHALTGRHAYPARTFGQLGALWEEPLAPPSRYAPHIPDALDRLIMDLMQLEAPMRPANAAEVSQRLSAIAGLEQDETLLSSRAYLTTPVLVGRDQPLLFVRRRLKRLQSHNKGTSVLVRGSDGVGRSRFLDACVLEGKLGGASVLKVSASDAASHPFGAIQSLAEQWLHIAEATAMAHADSDWSLLANMLPCLALADRKRPLPALDPDQPRDEATAAVRRWFLAAAADRPLAIVVDDVDLLDTESQAFIALLAHDAAEHRLAMLTSWSGHVGDEAPNDAVRLLQEISRALELGDLERSDTHALLASVFGEVPNLHTLVESLFGLTGGNPKNLMQLSQHLLTREVVRYDAGAWVLPERFDEGDLPADMSQALAAVVAGLEPDARTLASCMALYPDQGFSLDDGLVLLATSERAAAHAALDGLRAASVVHRVGDQHVLANQAWAEALQAQLDDGDRPRLHTRLGQVFRVRDDGMRAARSLFRGGCEAEGLDVIVDHAIRSSALTNVHQSAYVRLLVEAPRDWVAIYEEGLRLCQAHGRPARDAYAIHNRMVSLGSPTNEDLGAQTVALANLVARAAGLDIYRDLCESDPHMSEAERLGEALKRATVRYMQTPEAEQLFPPKEALGHLVRVLIVAIGNMGNTLDVAHWEQMPALGVFAPLSPALALGAMMQRGFEARLKGRFDEARAIYIESLKALEAASDHLEATYVSALRSGISVVLGVMEAGLGLPECDERVATVQTGALHEASGLMIRAIQALFQGDAGAADELQRQREIRRLERPHPAAFQGLILIWNMQAHAACNDLTRAKQDLEAIERAAARVATWQPVLDWARGEMEIVKGNAQAALAHLDQALSQMPSAAHMLWAPAMAARLRALNGLERHGDLQRDARQALARATEHGLGYQTNLMRMPLAISLAQLGEQAEAWAVVEETLAALAELGVTGLSLGLAHETAIRVALLVDDHAAFDKYMALLADQASVSSGRLFTTKHMRLQREARRTWPIDDAAWPDDGLGGLSAQLARLRSQLDDDDGAEARLQSGLEFLAAQTGATAAALFRWDDLGAAMCARVGDTPVSVEVLDKVTEYLDLACGDSATRTCDLTQLGDPSAGHVFTHEGHRYHLVLLSHSVDEGLAVSGAVLVRLNDGVSLEVAFEISSALSRVFTSFGDLTTQIAFA